MVGLVACLARNGSWSILRTDHLGMQVFRGLLTVVALWLVFYGLAHMPLADSLAITYLRPVFVVVLGVLLLGEDASFRHWMMTLLSLMGALIVIGPAFEKLDWVYFIAVLGAIVSAGSVAATKVLGRHSHPTTILAYLALILLICSPVALLRPWPVHEWPAFLAVAFAGAFSMWFGLLAVREADVSLIAPFEYLRLPFGFLIGMLIFSETPSWPSVIGSILILLSVSTLIRTKGVRVAISPRR
jgi:drug/metabolite transporter (DMT)-like permease